MNVTDLHKVLGIFVRYDPKDYIAAEHDEIWIGGVRPDRMTEEERKTVADCHVTWDSTTESWHGFV